MFVLRRDRAVTSSLDLAGLIPYIYLAWIGAAVLATAELVADEFRGDFSARSFRSAAWRCVSVGSFFTIYFAASEAHSRKLISVGPYLVAIIVACLLVAAGNWWLAKR
jgi:hypothetical protein